MTNELASRKSGWKDGGLRTAGRVLAVLLFMFGLVVTNGCRTSPIKDVSGAPVTATGASLAQVGKAIQTAGAGLGWVMKEEYPGLIVGTLNLRDHMARVEIPYTTTSYSIRYKDSSNLKYDAAKRSIHSNYNGWVSNLHRAISAQLSLL